MREFILFVHRWLGLTVGAVFGIASLTGALLVFETELDVLFNRNRFATTAGLLTPAELDTMLPAIVGAGELRYVRWPAPRLPVFEVGWTGSEGERMVWLDPGSGREVQPLHGRSRIMPAIRRAHTTLFAGRIGHWVVTLSSLVALLGLLTGAILWWPGWRRIAKGFAMRLRRGTYILNYDLHQTLGILALPLLILLTVTGVLIPFPGPAEGAARRVLRSGEPVREWSDVSSRPIDTPVVLSLDSLISRSQRAADVTADPDAVLFPPRPDGVIDVRLRLRPPGEAGGNLRVLIDRYDGSVLQVRDPRDRDRAQRFATTDVFNMHIGAFGGSVIRWLWLVSCLIGALSLPTGVVVWWLKRTRRVLAGEQRAARLGTQPSS